MTGGAGEAVFVKSTIDVRVSCQAAGKHDDRIVAAIAVAREFDAFSADEDVDAGAVERSAEGVGVQCLTPLAVSFVVAMGAVFGIREGTWLNELVALGGSIAGEGKVVFAEKEVVGFADFVRVILAFRIFAGLGVSGEGSGSREQDEAKQETGENCD